MNAADFSERAWKMIPGWRQGEIFPPVIRSWIVGRNSCLPDTDPAHNQSLAARPGADDKPLLVFLPHFLRHEAATIH